jgi:cation transport regulator ChaB
VSSAVRDAALDAGIQEALGAFAYGPEGVVRLTEESFLALPPPLLAERCNSLIESCRKSPRREAAQAVESFVVFFQALVPTLRQEAAGEVKATFFRLAPTLLQMAWDDYRDRPERREDARLALKQIEDLLHEVASVSLAPAESELLFRSLDQLGTLIKGGEYALARDLVAGPLVGILRKNRVARSLFRLMEVEVAIQRYLQERLGYTTPQLRLPDDVAALSEFGPVRVFDEQGFDGTSRRYLQLQLPDIPILSHIVVHLARASGTEQRNLRLDGLGSVELDLPPGLYRIGLAYSPEDHAGG